MRSLAVTVREGYVRLERTQKRKLSEISAKVQRKFSEPDAEQTRAKPGEKGSGRASLTCEARYDTNDDASVASIDAQSSRFETETRNTRRALRQMHSYSRASFHRPFHVPASSSALHPLASGAHRGALRTKVAAADGFCGLRYRRTPMRTPLTHRLNEAGKSVGQRKLRSVTAARDTCRGD